MTHQRPFRQCPRAHANGQYLLIPWQRARRKPPTSCHQWHQAATTSFSPNRLTGPAIAAKLLITHRMVDFCELARLGRQPLIDQFQIAVPGGG